MTENSNRHQNDAAM